MGLKLYPGSIKGQADSIIQNLESDNKDLLSALQTISQFVQNTELKGAAWDSMKYQLGNHEAVIQGLICANESVIQEHENLKSTVGDENLDEDELIAKRDALMSTNTFLEKNISLMQSNMQNDVMKMKYGFWYQEMMIFGRVDPAQPKLDLETAKKIVAENTDFETILEEFDKIQPYPDYIGGSGITRFEYWVDGSTNPQITIYYEQKQIYGETYNEDGTPLDTELLFG